MLDRFVSLDELPDRMQAEARQRALLDHVPLPVFLKDATLGYVAANPAFARILGSAVECVLGKRDAAWFPSPIAERLEVDDRKILESGITLEREQRYRDNGVWRILRFRKAPVFGPQGIAGVAGACWDCSELREAEARARHKQKIDAVAHLAGGVAHDFNNLLSAILGNLSLARDLAMRPDDPQIGLLPGLLAMAESAGKQAATLTRQLLGFARRFEPHPEIFSVNTLLRELAQTRPLRLRLAEDVWPVRVDRAHLAQIIELLLRFAHEAMQCQTAPHLETVNVHIGADAAAPDQTESVAASEARPGEFVRVRIEVTCGVRVPASLPTLLDPFAAPLSHHRGASLALAMAHGLLKEQDGWMDCQAGPDDGLDFALFLPRWAPSAWEPRAQEHDGASVLLIEDHDVIRNIGAEMLESLGYQVLGAASAGQALEMLRVRPEVVDLVMLDLTLPGEDPDSFARELHELAPDMPLVLCAAYPTAQVRRAVERLAAAGCIAKPFERNALGRTVRAALERAWARPTSDSIAC
ncbi:MAG: PAS domain-containing protein [Gemmataceae bacterium]